MKVRLLSIIINFKHLWRLLPEGEDTIRFGHRQAGKSRFIISMLIAISFLTGWLVTQAAAQVSHTVKAGDTLYKIGQNYGFTGEQLQRTNSLNSTVIRPGQVILIPTVYTVQNGDSWYRISQKFGVTVTQLKNVNALWRDLLWAGEKIMIPAAASGTRSAAVTSSRGFNGYTREDITNLARVIHAEAGGESYTGQVAVGAVVLNRTKSSGFPATISEVIFQKNAFSSVSEGTFWNQPSTSCLNAADDALKGWDPTDGAIYFYNPSKPCVAWIFTRTVIKRIGNHVFAK